MKLQRVENRRMWARAIAGRISDEWSGSGDFPEDAELMRDVLEKCLVKAPGEMRRLIGMGIIEEDYFEPIQ